MDIKDDNKLEIIVVEDSPNISSIIKKSKSLDKYHFTFFSDGLSVLNFLTSNHKNPDLVILEYDLSSHGGAEILNKTKQTGKNLKFLFISKIDSAVNAVNAIKSGAIDYIVNNSELKLELPNIIDKAICTSNESIQNRKDSIIEEELQKSRGALVQITDNIPVFISLVNKDLEYIFVNREYENFFGINKSKIIGKKVKEIIGNEAFERAYPKIIKALEGQSHTFENNLTNKKGEDRIIQTTYTPFFQNNIIDGLIILVLDITEQKRVEEKLIDSATRWQTTFDAVNDAVCILDTDQHILHCNKAMSDLFPENGKDLVGKHCWEVVHGTKEPHHECPLKKMRRSLQRESLELKIADRWFDITVDPLFGADMNLTGAIHIVRDITERKQIDEVLQKSELKYRIVADNTSDWEFWVSNEGEFLYTSPSCLQLTGYESSNFINDPMFELKIVHPEDLDKLKNHTKNVHLEKVISGLDYRIILPNGDIKWISQKCQPVFGSNNEYLGIRGSNRDITGKKLAEIEIEESNKKLKELNSSKDKFFSIIAHDLINPFNTLLGFSDLLIENLNTYSQNKIESQVHIINEAAKSCFNLLDNLLTWSRTQTGSIEINPSNIDLEIITLDLINQFHPLTLKKNINLISIISPKTMVYADENMVKTIIRNLISNAIKFTKVGGVVVLNTSEKNGIIEYSVEDNGVGIDPGVIDNLFQIDRNVSTTGTDKERGSGLGLILCKDFVEKNGGKIWVISELNVGSEFKFTLPKTSVKSI